MTLSLIETQITQVAFADFAIW